LDIDRLGIGFDGEDRMGAKDLDMTVKMVNDFHRLGNNAS
jgi:hypothetical protein